MDSISIDHAPGQFNLYQFPDKFVVEPVLGEGSLEIDRYSNDVNLKITSRQQPLQSSHQAIKVDRINGLVGIIELVSGPYLIFIKSATSVGMFNDAEIFKVVEAELVPFKSSNLHLSERERRINQNFVEMLKNVLSTENFYYSIGMDISRSFQWLSENASPELHLLPLLQKVDKKFVWNAKLSEKFNTVEFSKFIQPLIHGFVGIRRCRVNNLSFNLALISRRSVYRPGVRFHTRGADSEGNCANFVETEQLVEFDVGGKSSNSSSNNKKVVTSRHIASFIQIRGSIPIYWTQKPNLKWQPTPSLKSSADEQFNCFKQHLNNLLDCYGRDALTGNPRKILLLSLLNQYGREKNVGSQFRSVVEKIRIPSVKYIAFDFHRHCQSLNWKRLSYLKEEIMPDIRQFGFFSTHLSIQGDFWIEANPENRQYQNGFIRTNCMDCLDRTNVVQALIGIESLRFQLQYFGIINESVFNFDAWPEFVFTFKNLWADNGDICSKQYAGTGALKTDYTRVGKRTFGGMVNDLNNSLTRYFKNNFTDGYKQDALNLFLLNYTVDRNSLPERADHSIINFDTNGAAIAGAIFSVAMALLCILISDNISASFFWFVIFILFMAFIWVNGDDFVDNPLLVHNNN
uniref:Phosphatidylinositol-3-phosphatase SAC1 n=1 Tax=Meloidogyne incognita TaxID=6306 RepID=A0A914LXL3_MELIC